MSVTTRVRVLFALVALISFGSASAEVLFTHPWENQVNGSASRVGGQEIADDFILPGAPGTVDAVSWMGLNTPHLGNPPPLPVGATTPFRLRFYFDEQVPPAQANNLNHRPSAALIADVLVNAQVTAVQAVPFPGGGGADAFLVNYRATVPTGVVAFHLFPQWLSILSAEPAIGFDWLLGHPGGNAVFRGPGIGNGTDWHEIGNADHSDYVFTLEGTF